MKVGIEAIHFDVPKIYLPIEDLAIARGIEPAKLQLGLGLERMSFPDIYQDAVVFGANALKKLIEKEQLKAEEIDRIYVGTESAVDGSKPVASYILSLIENQCFAPQALSHTDVVDFTFACIGGVDALQNSVDFVRLNPNKKAIVIATDMAKYELKSTGEYTQGAGAVALLVSANPSLLSFESDWAVSTAGVFDFFKPRRRISVDDIEFKDGNKPEERVLEIFKEQPVFDGQYSNSCYLQRTEQAYFRLKEEMDVKSPLYQDWKYICMHLPYCFQARRIFTEFFIEENPDLKAEKEQTENVGQFIKSVSKSEEYKSLVAEKIQPTEIASGKIGNMYTASIFMGMLSALCNALKNNEDLIGKKVGFLAYGSGSKSKAFEGKVEAGWKEKIEGLNLFVVLDNTRPISVEAYERLHLLEQENSIHTPEKEFYLDKIETEKGVTEGARYYKFAQ